MQECYRTGLHNGQPLARQLLHWHAPARQLLQDNKVRMGSHSNARMLRTALADQSTCEALKRVGRGEKRNSMHVTAATRDECPQKLNGH